MSQGNRYNGAQLILAFLGGAAVGAAAALLAAPHTGAETRDQLKRWGKDAQGVAGKVPNALRDAAMRAAEAAKEAFREALEDEGAGKLEAPETVETS